MWKKNLSIALAGFLLLSFMISVTSHAQEEKTKSARQLKAEEQKRAKEEAERTAKRAEMEKKIRQELRQLDKWTIYIVPTGASPVKIPISKDTLIFTDISVTSEYLSEKGFRNSNYSLSANDDGMGVWETMQRSSNADIAFWKGQVKDMAMKGVLGIQPAKKGQPMQEFTFTTERPAGYIEPPAPKKTEDKAKKGEPIKVEEKVSTPAKN